MDRRTSIKWMLAAGAVWNLAEKRAAQAGVAQANPALKGRGYGTDPKLTEVYRVGQYWPLTLTAAQRRLAGILSDIILPADEHSPSASSVGVVDFIDEWVSAPYPDQQRDRPIVLEGFAWLDTEGQHLAGRSFSDLDAVQQHAICDDICSESRALPARRAAATFFALYRDLTAGGFYSSPAGRKDLNYIGNVPLSRFDGPPPELLKALGLA